MDTKVLPNHTPILAGLEHPSLPGETIPAVLTNQPAQRDICPHCVWLARMIRAGRYVEDYGWLAICHVAAFHPDSERGRLAAPSIKPAHLSGTASGTTIPRGGAS